MLREPSSEYLSNYDEAVFGVQKTSLTMFRKYSPSSANIVFDWLRAKRALLWMREKEQTWMRVSILLSLRSEMTYFMTCGRLSRVSGTQNDNIVVS